MGDVRTYTVQAEPLTAEGFAPFGQVIGQGDCAVELRDGEVFHLDVISYVRKPIRVDHLNRHYKATQALVPLAGKPAVIVVGPPSVDFSTADHLSSLRAFVMEGSSGINLALRVWHEGPFPLSDRVDLANFQGRNVEEDNEVAYLERDLGVVVTVAL